ncbi:MAG: 16S rRNA (cytosine(1402)-N(4))-methyltransferase RsmH, partial [Bacilli bacterium]
LQKRGVSRVDGVLFDLGVSSPQLDDASRGFSFHSEARLDMRMDRSQSLSAYEVVNDYEYKDLVRIIFSYGEEKYAKQIARAIEKSREERKIETTLELVDVISNAVPAKYKRLTHPARRTFQAIRIEVNKELSILPKAFDDAISVLNNGGMIAVITFHSLEDKICKTEFKKHSSISDLVKGLPVIPNEYLPELEVLKKIKPSKEELEGNPRSRSATLRVARKLRRD